MDDWKLGDEGIVNNLRTIGICDETGIIAEVYKEGKWKRKARMMAAVPEMFDLVESLEEVEVSDCAHCNEQSWYGEEHTSDCPSACAVDLIKKINKR